MLLLATFALTRLLLSTPHAARLVLNEFASDSLVSEGLKTAGMEGDVRMIKLWTQLKVGALEAEGKKAAQEVS